MRRHHGFTLIEIMVVITIIGILSGLIAINAVTSDPQKDLNREADRLKAVIEMAEEEALFGRQDFGIVVTEDSYQFVRYERPPDNSSAQQQSGSSSTSSSNESQKDERESQEDPNHKMLTSISMANVAKPEPQWETIPDGDQFKAYTLSNDYEIHLEVDDEEVDPSGGKTQTTSQNGQPSKYDGMDDEDKLIPAIYISPSGEITPFVMEIYLKEDSNVTVKISGDETGRIWIGDDDEG